MREFLKGDEERPELPRTVLNKYFSMTNLFEYVFFLMLKHSQTLVEVALNLSQE